MYQHHEESLKIMEKMFREREGVIALVFGGSVAKGMERPDSDLDGMVIVTDACYEELAKENRLAEVIPGHCTYEGGYFDVKIRVLREIYDEGVSEAGGGERQRTHEEFLCEIPGAFYAGS